MIIKWAYNYELVTMWFFVLIYSTCFISHIFAKKLWTFYLFLSILSIRELKKKKQIEWGQWTSTVIYRNEVSDLTTPKARFFLYQLSRSFRSCVMLVYKRKNLRYRVKNYHKIFSPSPYGRPQEGQSYIISENSDAIVNYQSNFDAVKRTN